jgi:hypothetical protein
MCAFGQYKKIKCVVFIIGIDEASVKDRAGMKVLSSVCARLLRSMRHPTAVPFCGRRCWAIVINGSEITRDMPPGHSNAVFVSDANHRLEDDVMTVFREAERQGAFTFWNHPMWTAQTPSGLASLTDLHRTLIEEGMLDGIEVVTQHTYSAEALAIALEHDLTILGTSDIHGLIDWDYGVHDGGHRPITLVFVEKRSKEGLREALLAGRAAVWYNNQPPDRAR